MQQAYLTERDYIYPGREVNQEDPMDAESPGRTVIHEEP
jgi:hypothetical protein